MEERKKREDEIKAREQARKSAYAEKRKAEQDD